MAPFIVALYQLYGEGRGSDDAYAGQGLVEYGLILFLVVIVALVGVALFGGGVNGLWGRIHNSMPWN